MSLVALEELRKNTERIQRTRDDVVDWQTNNDDDFTHEITLTFPLEPKDIWQCEKVFGVFKVYLNERCFKYGKHTDMSIKMGVMLEGKASGKRLHYHCAMRCPKHMTRDYFSRKIAKTWKNTVQNKSARVVIKQYTNSGWLSYTAKEIKPLHTSAVSIHTSY